MIGVCVCVSFGGVVVGVLEGGVARVCVAQHGEMEGERGKDAHNDEDDIIIKRPTRSPSPLHNNNSLSRFESSSSSFFCSHRPCRRKTPRSNRARGDKRHTGEREKFFWYVAKQKRARLPPFAPRAAARARIWRCERFNVPPRARASGPPCVQVFFRNEFKKKKAAPLSLPPPLSARPTN
jgi:hypothetical protein